MIYTLLKTLKNELLEAMTTALWILSPEEYSLTDVSPPNLETGTVIFMNYLCSADSGSLE